MTPAPTPPGPRRHRRAFTLIEMLVSMAILAMILVLTANMVGGTQKTLRTARASAEQFAQARRAFETITRRLSQATLNTHWDYDDPRRPTEYLRQSDLHFVTGPARDLLPESEVYGHAVFFVAPFGFAGTDATGGNPARDPYRNLESLLNAWGYYITWSEDDDAPPFIRDLQDRGVISETNGFRLMEFRQPSEKLRIYADALRTTGNLTRPMACRWFHDAVKSDLDSENVSSSARGRTSRVVAENILAMIIRPVISTEDAKHNKILGEEPWEIAPNFLFDSREWQWATPDTRTLANRNQVPPVLELTLVALHDDSFRAFQNKPDVNPREDLATALEDLFSDAEELDDDLDTLGRRLDDLHLKFRVFQASVGLRTAKWSD